MQRNKPVLHIRTGSGSGTSTIGKFISDKLGYFFMDTDDYFWEVTDPPYQIKRNISDRITLMKNDIAQHDKVVISGSLVDWGDELIPLFTLAIRVETDTAIRIDRLRKRERKHFGNRIDKDGDMYENHQEFIDWAASYDTGDLSMRSKLKHDEWQKQLLCQIILLDGSLPVEKNFTIIQQSL
ncbi:MAG: shikimate kinase [Lachnospiraceae bacterium]|nr:shikimate kinase [Lachnospiraceae bacterium]MBD5456537.1 shikimate kinase [Lachnospiraceae bacterium]